MVELPTLPPAQLLAAAMGFSAAQEEGPQQPEPAVGDNEDAEANHAPAALAEAAGVSDPGEPDAQTELRMQRQPALKEEQPGPSSIRSTESGRSKEEVLLPAALAQEEACGGVPLPLGAQAPLGTGLPGEGLGLLLDENEDVGSGSEEPAWLCSQLPQVGGKRGLARDHFVTVIKRTVGGTEQGESLCV